MRLTVRNFTTVYAYFVGPQIKHAVSSISRISLHQTPITGCYYFSLRFRNCYWVGSLKRFYILLWFIILSRNGSETQGLKMVKDRLDLLYVQKTICILVLYFLYFTTVQRDKVLVVKNHRHSIEPRNCLRVLFYFITVLNTRE